MAQAKSAKKETVNAAAAVTEDVGKTASARKRAAKPAAKATAKKSEKSASTKKKPASRKASPSGKLVIVESPAKAGTISKFLGRGYKVIASYGHVLDLPKSRLGVDVENNFSPEYIKLKGKAETINAIKKEAKGSKEVYLATDPDREGEAISWHIANLLDIDQSTNCRIEFNEITPTAVKNAIASPRRIDQNLVDAQQARRILDRLVGYKISPILWSKVRKGLSAGRVQSVATRIVCDREEEIRKFIPEEYWTIEALLKSARTGEKFTAALFSRDGKKLPVKSKEQSDEILAELKNAEFTAAEIKRGEKKRSPAPPFTTSNLQQEASRKLGFTTKRTMSVAQQLYESGNVTYIRTDSVRISEEAIAASREYIVSRYGGTYLPQTPNYFKGRKGAQDAHEAIRPTHLELTPEQAKASMALDQYKLYKLVYERFVASQMNPAVFETISASIQAGRYGFRASGQRMLFDGFMKVYTEGVDTEKTENEGMLPPMEEGDIFPLEKLKPEQHFTQPPPRYTEASLVRALEEKGIGRPSTYAPTISTIIERDYVKREKKTLIPTELGEIVTNLMKDNFEDIVDIGFTAHMEEELDGIEDGEKSYPEVLKEFYTPFKQTLEKAEATIEKRVIEDEVSDIPCDKCGAMMVYKTGKFGRFLACPNYPECKNTKEIGGAEPEESDIVCDKCGAKMVLKTGKFGKFYACPNYPECKNTKPFQKAEEVAAPCPKCGAKVIQKRSKKGGKLFYGCSRYPDCDYVSWDEPIEEKCPKCGGNMVIKRLKSGDEQRCTTEGCGYRHKLPANEAADG